MSSPKTCSAIPEWRRNSGQQNGTKTVSPTSWRSRSTTPPSPTRSRQSSEELREGGARTGAERLAGRAEREERVRKLLADVVVPKEAKRCEMYKQIKISCNPITDWLVDTVYPNGKDLPKEIEVLRDPLPDFPKYKVVVNFIVTLAETVAADSNTKASVIATKLSLIDKNIPLRAEYSHWIHQIDPPTPKNTFKHDEHQHFIDILEDVRTILNNSIMDMGASKPTPTAKSPSSSPIQRHTSTLGKRNRSPSISHTTSAQTKAPKITTTPTQKSSAPEPMKVIPGAQNLGGCTRKKSWAAIAATAAAC